MASILTKFGIGDTAYTFDYQTGKITRFIIKAISINTSTFNTEIFYEVTLSSNTTYQSAVISKNVQNAAEQDLYTEDEVKDLANSWLIDKSVSIFTNAGL